MASTFAPKSESATYAYLRASGWTPIGLNQKTGRMEWRNSRLNWPWTTAAAAQLQRDADAGGQECVHRMLRGEA